MLQLLRSVKTFALAFTFAGILATGVVVQANSIDNSSEDYRLTSNYEAVRAGYINSKTVSRLEFNEYNHKGEYGNLCLNMIEAFLNDDGKKFKLISDYLIDKFPDRWQNYFFRGYYEENQFKFIDAINYYIEALKLNPNSWMLNKNIGRAYMEKAVLSAGITLKENNVNSSDKFLLMLMSEDEAYKEFSKAFNHESSIAHIYLTKAINIYEANPVNTKANIVEILDTYNKAAITTKNAEEALAYYNKVLSYKGREKLPWLQDDLTKIYVEAYAGAGDCYIRFGQYDEALLMYNQGCILDKNSELLQKMKAKLDLAKSQV